MQQPLGQTQLGQTTQIIQQSAMAQAQQQMAQSQIAQQQINQSQITQQQIAQSQLAQQQQHQQQQLAQSQLVQQQQQQMAQQQLAQQQIAQTQMVQQQIAQSHLVHQQIAQSQMAQHQMNQPQIVQQQMTQPQMIQQQMANQQIGQQQLQQMMYCPTVRLVYDTPMQLMQPSGEQIQQQNQNIFVNQPPWARPVQNQVIYVQQIGSNLVPVQHLDPNMFLQQNIPMYQQVVQNVPQLVQNLPQTVQSLPQGQIRQIINNIPAGIVPNFGTNVQRIPEQNLGQVVQNFGLVQANTDVTMNNVNLPSNEANRQTIANQTTTQTNASTQEPMPVYRQIVPHSNQQQQTRPQAQISQQHSNVQNAQTMTQQIVTNIGQNISNANIRPAGNVGTINTSSSIGVKGNNVRPTTAQIPNNVPNMNHIIRTSTNQILNTTGTNVGINMQPVRHIIQTQNVNAFAQHHNQNLINAPIAVQNYATAVGTLNTVTYSAVRNGQPYTYRAIQPKPNNNNVRVNFKPRGNPMQMVRRPVAPNVPNINQNVPVSTNTIPTSTNYIKMETDNPTFNRKRKSESPDEIQKKISNYGSITVTAQVKDKIKAKYANTSEVGVNTSPVHKMHKVNQNKVESPLPLLQINPMEAKIKQTLHSPTSVSPNTTAVPNNNANIVVKTEAGVETKEKKDSKDVSQQTEEKLVRKTVFPQAKATGRLLDAKSGLDMPKLDDIHNVHNAMNNESCQAPRIDDIPKDNTQLFMLKQMLHTNFKQTEILNEKVRTEETKVVKSTVAMTTSSTSMTDAIVNTQKPANTPLMISKPDDTKSLKTTFDETKVEPMDTQTTVPVELKKDTGMVLQTNKDTITESKAMEVERKIDFNDSSKVTNNVQINTNIKQTEKIVEKIAEKIAEKIVEKNAEKTKIEVPITETKIIPESVIEEEIKDNKIEKTECKNVIINEISGKEIHIVDGNIHEEKRDFVLTHVLDGFVIQESNVPFAIRRPLKEKTVNAFVEDKTDPCIKAAKDEIRGQLSQLHLNENREKERLDIETRLKMLDENAKIKEEEKPSTEIKTEEISADIVMKDNPFESLKRSVVKSWTVDDLASHLAKHGWTETVSTLQEHEIDGESLFLVTKIQLVTIGLNEAHADAICEFVGSKS